MKDDTISRQTLKDLGAECIAKRDENGNLIPLGSIDSLPSVSTEKTGHWRHYEGMLICSECGAEFYDDIMEYCGDDVPKCCPDCGTKMQKEMTYRDVYEQFYNKFPNAEGSDWRPADPMFIPQLLRPIPNAIIVWLKDGSKVVYIAESEDKE